MKNKSINLLKILVLIIVIILCIILIMYLFPIIKNISTKEGQIEFKKFISESGIKGVFLLFALELAQIFLVILPGEPLEIISGMCYGAVNGTIFILVSVFITTTIIFYAVRKYGRDFIYNFYSQEKVEKLENSKWFQSSKNIEYIFVILFMLPGTPKDLLVYIGGLLPVNSVRFILISTFARFPSIISSTLAGANIVQGNWIMMLIVYIIPIMISIGIIIGMKMLEKKKSMC